MSKAVVDTTILTDVLLNSGEAKTDALKALRYFDETLLPVYAIKEFKAGPLKNFTWLHNKLAIVESYEIALDALQRMSRTPKRYTTSTALQALKKAAGSIGRQTSLSLKKKYGEKATIDKILCDEFRLTLKFIIMSAWKKRRKITTHVIQPLPCYRESPPYEKRGLLELEPKRCNREEECSLAPLLKSKPYELLKMRDAIKDSEKIENKRRAKTLRQLFRTPKVPLHDKDCVYLGDAIFVFISPEDAVILTTNTADHIPLANAVGKKAVSPHQLFD